ncbi:MAG TPA: hypothetical protein VKO85_10405 [Wenzhouxiangellaceae bacterium]|nr:hypothetical protein [Wenzhouxiangellaceae bacterium]
MMIRHFARLPAGLVALWCFLFWYLAMTVFHFEGSLRLWGNALGMSLIVGSALLLSVQHGGGAAREFWRSFRLFMIPFCVSSFSALVRDDDFYAIFSPILRENLVAAGLCLLFLGWVALARRLDRKGAQA